MRNILPLSLGLLAGLPLLAAEQPQTEWEISPLTDQGWVEHDFSTGVTTGTNGVLVKFGEAVLTAEQVALHEESGQAIADGAVRIQRGEEIWAAERMTYNFNTHQMEAEQFRTGKPPVFAAGHGLHGELTNQVYVATNAFITVEDVSQPLVQLRAKQIKIIPGKQIEARDAILYIGHVPVFYFPYYSRNLSARANNFNFIPGYRSSWGPFILGHYTWFLNDQFDGDMHLDYRGKRGPGVGPDINYHLGQWGQGTMRYYYTYDKDPLADAAPGSAIPNNRERVYFTYQSAPYTNLEVRSMVRYQSDTNIVREFFEGEYRQDPQPSTYLEVNKFWQNFSLDTYVQPRVNDFLETVEKLPDVRLTGYRQELGASPVYYQSESSAGYYNRMFAMTNNQPTGMDYSAERADTFQQLLLPETLFGWLNLTPNVGGRYTYYSQANGPGATTEAVSRGIFSTGAELSFKASRLWPEVKSDVFELDGLRHIVEPSVTYALALPNQSGTNVIPQFDYESASLPQLPLDFPSYNSIDSIERQNVFRFGVRNRLQTKRDGQVVDVVDWQLSGDLPLQSNQSQNSLTDIYSELTLRPTSWMTIGSQTRIEVTTGQFRFAYDTLRIEPNTRWSWLFGHWYLQNNPGTSPTALGPGDSVLISLFRFRLNENYGLEAAQHYDLQQGQMQSQTYTIYRDMRSWTVALSVRMRENTTGPNDLTVAFTFSLKAVPRFQDTRPAWYMGG